MSYEYLYRENKDKIDKLNLKYINNCNFALCTGGSIIHKHFIYRHLVFGQQHMKRIRHIEAIKLCNDNTFEICVCGDIIRKNEMDNHIDNEHHLQRMEDMNHKIDLNSLAFENKKDVIDNYYKIHNEYPNHQRIGGLHFLHFLLFVHSLCIMWQDVHFSRGPIHGFRNKFPAWTSGSIRSNDASLA